MTAPPRPLAAADRSPPATGPPASAPAMPAASSPAPSRPPATPPWLPAFCAVFREQYAYVVHFLGNLGLRARDVDDVAQEVFVIVFRRFHLYDPTRPVRPWLCAFAVHCARAHRRRSSRPPDSLDDFAERPDPPQPGAPLDETIAARRSVRRGLAALSDEQREVFVLHELLGFTVPEVAEIVGILVNTAYSRLRLARANFVNAVHPSEERHDDDT
jgi:RNA polymerase sigma-70 factor (ECF subfamily)